MHVLGPWYSGAGVCMSWVPGSGAGVCMSWVPGIVELVCTCPGSLV